MKQVLIPTAEPGEFKCRPCGTTVKGSGATHVSMSPWPHATLLATMVPAAVDPMDGRAPWAWEPGANPYRAPEGDLLTAGPFAEVR